MKRRVEIIQCILQWRRENEQQGIEVTLTDAWTPEERQRLLAEWTDDDGLQEVLSQQNDEIFQELPREISLSQQDNQLELQDETSSIDSLIAWLEDPRTLAWIDTQHDDSLTEWTDPLTDPLTEWINTYFDANIEQNIVNETDSMSSLVVRPRDSPINERATTSAQDEPRDSPINEGASTSTHRRGEKRKVDEQETALTLRPRDSQISEGASTSAHDEKRKGEEEAHFSPIKRMNREAYPDQVVVQTGGGGGSDR